MSPGPPPSIQLNTAHLLMRPTGAADGGRAFEIQSDWDVARMLALAAFPPDLPEIERWFAEHSQEWLAGSAYRFAAVRENKLIGVVASPASPTERAPLATGPIEPSGASDTPPRPPGPS